MAEKTGTKNGKSGRKREHYSIWNDERVLFTIGLFVLLLGLYYLLALVSYLFTWKIDQSFEWANLLSGSDIKVQNWTGRLGAIISAQFITHWFGIASLAFSLFIFAVGLRLFKLYRRGIVRFFFKVLTGVLLGSLLMGFLFGTTGGYLGSGLGGSHGLFVSSWMVAILGNVGTAFMLLLFTIAYLIYIKPSTMMWFERALLALVAALGRLISMLRHSDGSNKNQSDNLKAPVSERNTMQPDDSTGEVSEPEMPDAIRDEIRVHESDLSQAVSVTGNEPLEFLSEAIVADEPKIADSVPNTIPNKKVDEEEGVEFTVEELTEKELPADRIDQGELYDPTLELSSYQRPLIELLEDYRNTQSPITNEVLIANKNKIVETLSHYKIHIDKIKATIGPTVTLYEIVPAPGVRISKIKNLEDDIALSLAALGIRIIAPIPGKGTIGIEVPNVHPEIVSMHSVIKSQKFQESKYELAIALGKTISNEIFLLDLAKLPHLLVAGATGQGKSVGLNAIIASLLYKKHPAELKFVLVDPKKVELTLYSKLEKHFLAKLPDTEEAIITDTQKVINTLNSLCIEMDQRYELLKLAQVRNIKEYNEKFVARRLNPNKGHKFLPYIVVIIDEFADLIMTAGREIEMPIARLAQLARAIGIHLIIATQRPSTNIITGTIKANFPARIAFRVSSMIDSRTILDHPGANNLIGRGDMLVSAGSDMVRVQCAFVDIPEIERIADFIGNQQGYAHAFILPEFIPDGHDEVGGVDLSKRDNLFEDAARLVVQSQMGSTSLIQRKFSIGYNRAGRIIDQLESAGIVGPFEGSKARQVLVPDEIALEQLLSNLNGA